MQPSVPATVIRLCKRKRPHARQIRSDRFHQHHGNDAGGSDSNCKHEQERRVPAREDQDQAAHGRRDGRADGQHNTDHVHDASRFLAGEAIANHCTRNRDSHGCTDALKQAGDNEHFYRWRDNGQQAGKRINCHECYGDRFSAKSVGKRSAEQLGKREPEEIGRQRQFHCRIRSGEFPRNVRHGGRVKRH
jgi:hypothetical protein